MAEIMLQLERIAYLAGRANTVEERRELDELLRTTETSVDDSAEEMPVAAAASA